MEFSVNHPILFVFVGLIIAAVIGQSVYFLVKSYRRAKEIGMEVFLLTHDLINKYDRDISDWPQGSFDDLMEYVRGLNK